MSNKEAPGDILALARAFYQEPIRYRHLLQARVELSDGADVLLRAAIGSEHVAEELRKAALFTIEQVFFAPGASHYQVLGLSQQAATEQIKVHHRLLMRLLHPDRSDTQETWMDAYAGRVNQAYNILRNPTLRRVYDESLNRSARQTQAFHERRSGRTDLAYAAGFSGSGINPFTRYVPLLLNRLPQIVLGATAVLGLLFVFWIYMLNQPVAVSVRASGVPTTKSSMLPFHLETTNDSIDDSIDEITRENQTAPVTERPVREQKAKLTAEREAQEREAKLAAEREAREREAKLVTERKAQEQKAKLAAEHEAREREAKLAAERKAREREAKLAAERKAQEQKAKLAAERKVREREAKLAAEREIREQEAKKIAERNRQQNLISKRDLNALLGRLIDTYERGDLEGFMALFDEQARSNNRNGKQAIRKDYEDLFFVTRTRQMALTGLNWNQEGEFAQGKGGVRLRVRYPAEQDFNDYRGTIRLEVLKRDGKVMIKSFYHDIE